MSKLKLIITESQMRHLIYENRIEALKKIFDIVSDEEWEKLSKKDFSKIKKKGEEGKSIEVKTLVNPEGELLALYMVEKSKVLNPLTDETEIRTKFKIRPSEYVLKLATNADPSTKKTYVQWIINSFMKLIKDGHPEEAIRFIDEDLSQANEYLTVFEDKKNDRLFKQIASQVEGLPSDPTNINQYKDLGQLFNAVESFLERDTNEMESALKQFVKAGEAKIPYQDSNWVVYNPLTRNANCAVTGTEFCTARAENSFFDTYTKNNKQPDGSPSKIYVIINKGVFKGTSDEIYQFHFETDQFRNRKQTDEEGRSGRNFKWVPFLDKNSGLKNFFIGVLTPLAKSENKPLLDNKYLKILTQLGEVDNLFDFVDKNVTDLNLTGFKMSTIPNEIGEFKNLEVLTLDGLGLKELPESIGNLTNLNTLILRNNNLNSLPQSIGKLKSLVFLNLMGSGNVIQKLPKSISQLDDDNGGELARLSLPSNTLESVVSELEKLLPNTHISLK